MIYPNSYDSFFGKESNEYGNITLILGDNLSVKVFPFETIEGEVLYDVSPMNEKVAACTLREIKSVRDTIKFYEDEILNYFAGRKTNASAESLNSKIKFFRSMVK